MYIAVVCKRNKRARNKHGEWSAFLAPTTDLAVERAMKARDEWHAAGHGPYDVLVGEVSYEARPLTDYILVNL